MKSFGYPVVFDATHSAVARCGDGRSQGEREYAPMLAKLVLPWGLQQYLWRRIQT